MSKKLLPQDFLRKYSSQKIDGATFYLHGHVLRAMMEYAKYAAEQVLTTTETIKNAKTE